MFQRLILFLTISTLVLSCNAPLENSDWRGPNRDGIYPDESGLLKSWPEEGPELLWSFEDLGFGHNSVAVANGRVYATGIRDTLESIGALSVFDLQGELLWQKDYGKDFTGNFIGSRSTPVIAGELIYIESGSGVVYCLEAESGEELWSVDFIKDLGVDSLIQFGYSESVLIDGEQLICVPGGMENNVVALDRFSGELIWSSEGNKEQATYNSPILVTIGSQRILIAMTASSIMGIDADKGEMFWRLEHTQGNNIHANTPIYYDGKLVMATPDPKSTSGMIQIQLSDEGKKAEVLWRNKKLRSFMGGVIRLDTCLYGSAYMRKDWQVLSWNTGEMLVRNQELGAGAVIYADGMFYCYAEQEGEIALVKAGPGSFEIVSKFAVPLGSREHWAHPVIHMGVLYVRHGEALMAYSI